MKPIMDMDATLQEDLSRIRRARIFFGHQSIGQNVLSGLQGLQGTDTSELNIIKVYAGGEMPSGPCLAHATIGENDNPSSKIKDFGEFLDREASAPWDVALMKFCYLDVLHETDVPKLFEMYREKVEALQCSDPNRTLIHVTVPLTRANGFKILIKKLLGKTTVQDDNIKRQEYNALLLREFGKESVFDLSRLESTHADGSRECFQRGAQTYFGLAAEYTEDDGHLNKAGSKVLAREFVRVFAEVLALRQSKGQGKGNG
jgi:hypothetical protein